MISEIVKIGIKQIFEFSTLILLSLKDKIHKILKLLNLKCIDCGDTLYGPQKNWLKNWWWSRGNQTMGSVARGRRSGKFG